MWMPNLAGKIFNSLFHTGRKSLAKKLRNRNSFFKFVTKNKICELS